MKKELTTLVMVALFSEIVACGDPVDSTIDLVVAGGNGANQAKIELVAAPPSEAGKIIQAMSNEAYTSAARIRIAKILIASYSRRRNPLIMSAFVDALNHPDPALRAELARAISYFPELSNSPALLERVQLESDSDVLREVLVALAAVHRGRKGVSTDNLSDRERQIIEDKILGMRKNERTDPMLSWLEIIAEQRSLAAADKVALGDVKGAEAVLLSCRSIVPDSKNILQKLGSYYYRNGETEKGIALLREVGLVARAQALDIQMLKEVNSRNW